MAAPYSPKRFHLVLAHDLRDTDPLRQSVSKFWTMRFPDALITDFPFLDDDANVGFLSRAQALLHTIQDARDTGGYVIGPDHHLPCIFICHGLGGSLVKQALVLASLDKKYGRYASDAALLVLCDTPEAAGDLTAWQLQVCRLLAFSNLDSFSITGLFNELPEALERLDWTFGAIQMHHSIVDIKSKGAESKPNVDTAQTLIIRGQSTVYTLADEASLWSFVSGNSTTESIFDRISRVVQKEIQPLSEQFHDFMRLLRRVDSNNYQLDFRWPFAGSIKSIAQAAITEHDSFRDWQNLDSRAPNLLYFRTPQGTSSSAIVSQVIGALGTSIPDYTIISFSFNKQDLRTQPIATFYVSLIRQLLLSHVSLFGRVSAIGDWIKGQKILSYEIFRSLLLSLLKGASPYSIICVLYAAQDCAGYSLDHIVDLIKDFRRLSNGIFKVLVVSEDPVHDVFIRNPDICRDINLSTASWITDSIKDCVRSKLGALAKNHPHWRGCENKIAENLCKPSVTYTQATTALRLLESKSMPSTLSAALEATNKLPSSSHEVYSAAVKHCANECPLPLETVLQWILHAVRPLSMNELSVVIGLKYSDPLSLESLRLNIPLTILNDLQQVKGTLITTVGLQALPIHKIVIPVLDERCRLSGEDADSVMLCTCLDYLEIILKNVPTTAPPPGGSGQNHLDCLTNNTEQLSSEAAADEGEKGEEYTRLKFDLTFMSGLEYDLVEYGVMSWPEHYKRARNREMVKTRILDLFGKNHEVQAWAALYQKYANIDTERFEKLDSLLNIGCRFGLLDIVKDVIGKVKDSKISRYALSKALDLAVGFGHDDIVSLLINEGAESNEAPSLAAEYGFLDILQQLVKANPAMAKVQDKFERSPFRLAALSGNEKIALYLMAKGVEHTTQGNGITDPEVAAMTGQLKLLSKLVGARSNEHTISESETKQCAHLLMLAAARGFDDIAQLLLSRGACIDDQNSNGETALHHAVEHGHASICTLLFTAGANIHMKTVNGLTPIHIASSNGHLGILQELLARSKDFLNQEEKPVNTVTKVQAEEEQATRSDVFDESLGVRTPLELAASNGHLDIMRELLKYPRFNSEKDCATALLIAANGGFPQLVDELLKTGIKTVMKDTNGNNALHLATQEQHPDIVASLLRSDSEAACAFSVNAENNSGWRPLHLAARSGRLMTVRTLLQNKADVQGVNPDGQTALHIASHYGHVEVSNTLIDYLTNHPPGRDVWLIEDKSGDTAFIIAVRQGHYEVANAFIEKSAPLNPIKLQGQKNALIESVNKNYLNLVELLLEYDWSVKAADANGNTPLHLAAFYGFPSITELLIDHNADCNAPNTEGGTPLHGAAVMGEKVAIRTLLEKGANINAKDRLNVTPLWLASLCGLDQVVEILLEWSPKPGLNAQNSRSGWAPLHACYDNAKITELLLKAGADPLVLNDYGNPPFFLSFESWRSGPEVFSKYIDAGIDINWKKENGNSLIHSVAASCIFEDFKFLHEAGADILMVGKNGETALHLATGNEYCACELLEYLLEQGADLEADCEKFGTPLMAAARRNRAATQVLLEKGAKVNAISKSCATHNALQTAASKGRDDIVEVLITAGADANIRGGSSGSALCAAVGRGDKKSVMLLLNEDKDINYAEGPQGSALELALSNQSLEIAELFFERGVDVNVVSKSKYSTALIAAVDVGEINAVERLLDLKADVNLFSAGGESPVQVAIRRGRQNIVEVLVKSGANLKYRDKRGCGILSHAISHRSFDLLPYLLQQPGVDIDQRDAFGRTPLVHATIQGHTIIDDILARSPSVNIQDRWGKTALAHAVSRDYGPLVSRLIAAHADPLIKDIRGRDALYWAALQASRNTFDQVLEKVEGHGPSSASSFQHAMIAAIAANNRSVMSKLKSLMALTVKKHGVPEHIDQDGWTIEYTRMRYGQLNPPAPSLGSLKSIGRPDGDLETQHALPTQWHPTDISEYLACQRDHRSVKLNPDVFILDGDVAAIARADHPMVPNKDGIYYFEIRVENNGSGKRLYVGVGFCDEKADLTNMLGYQKQTWGYHGAGNSFENGLTGRPYGPKFDDGSIVGCGVNFIEETAFYTHNGMVIGRAFTDIRGKLYPAVSIGTQMSDCTLTAQFWDKDESENKLFKFQGPYDGPQTLEPVQSHKNEGGAEQDEDSIDSEESTSSEESDSD